MGSDLERVLSLVADCIRVPVTDIAVDVELEAIGCDGLCKVEIALQVEDEFGVPIKGEADWRTPADIVRSVEEGRAACEERG